MKIKDINKKSKRSPRVIYKENVPETLSNAIFINPQDGNPIWNYEASGLLGEYGSNYPGCTNLDLLPVGSQLRRYCHIGWALTEYYKVKYDYYLGHKRSYQKVIQDKIGNCCDLSRLVNHIARDSLECTATCGAPLTNTQYTICNIEVDGEIYQHLFNELVVNNQWMTFDATNYIINGNARQIYGNIIGVLSRVPGSTDGAPCE